MLRRLVFRTLRALLILLVIAGVFAAGAGVWLNNYIRSSLPPLDGTLSIPGLSAAVEITRDDLGVPTISGESRTDVGRALGWIHAQDRFFQMDLSRRRAAGELAEIFGPVALPLDRESRVHRFRALARRVIEQAPPDDRALLDAYTDGVNAGLAALGARPVEYLALRVDPAPWQAEDSVLMVCSMFFELQDETGRFESDRALMQELLPPSLYAFLASPGTEWDAPLVGELLEPPPIPTEEEIDVHRDGGAGPQGRLPQRTELDDVDAFTGSNNWAVGGARTVDGRPLVANDMHLDLTVPNIWYRASLKWRAPDVPSGEAQVTGLTLAGAPAVAVGSNGYVAWGFTNTYADWGDLVIIDNEPGSVDLYRTPEGPVAFERHEEHIRVKGRNDEVLQVPWTIWGPVIDKDYRGRERALKWVAHSPEAVNLRFRDMETARSVDEALAIASLAGIPQQNLVVADRDGHIGWSIAGRIPRRFGLDGAYPESWADGTRGWAGWLSPDEYPRIVDPENHVLWTANNRTLDETELWKLGIGRYDVGARARQIRDRLLATPKVSLSTMLEIQLDDRALFLDRWRTLLLELLDVQALAESPERREFRQLVQASWTDRASVNSVGYRLVRGFRLSVAELALEGLTAPCKDADARFQPLQSTNYEGPVWQLVTARPEHLLNPLFESWRALLLAAADEVRSSLSDGRPLAAHTWGERNTTAIRHPLSRAMPLLSRWLDMPKDQLPGDVHMPRVQGPSVGASERMGVSPGNEAAAYFHMPAGQSGHPLSPHYADGHAAWVKGELTPFMPGQPIHRLVLQPK